MRRMKRFLICVVPFLLMDCAVGGAFCPPIKVWEAEYEGKAKYAEAESSRRIKVLEAQAALDSAKMLGEAEVVRASKTAEANKILGDSLKGNEAYLRYLWIDKIQAEKEVYYIPTEGSLPILEAGKRK